MTTSPAAVLRGWSGIRGEQEELYRRLHSHPELSHQEHRTAATVAGALRQAGLQVREGVGGTGVVGVLRNGDGPAVLVRADMDALPVREDTGLPYASTATATDGDGAEVPVMHACGHDLHSGSPREPEFELYDRFPLTDNDPAATHRVATAFTDHFGDRAGILQRQPASEDFSDLPHALGVPYTYWGVGGIDPEVYRRAEEAGRVSQDIPVNHSAAFAPALEPALATGTEALVVAALAWLAA